jgi:hypothetical protein
MQTNADKVHSSADSRFDGVLMKGSAEISVRISATATAHERGKV